MSGLDIDFRSPAVIADPLPAFARLRDEEPVHWNESLGAWCLTRFADVAQAFRDARFSADRIRPFVDGAEREADGDIRALGETFSLWLVFNDPPTHTRLRKLLNKGFTPAAVQRLRPVIRGIVGELIDRRGTSGEMDVIRDFAYPLPATVIADMLGVPRADLDRLKAWSDDIAQFVLVSRSNVRKYRQAAASLAETNDYFRALIAVRRANPGHAIIDGLIAAHDGSDSLSTEELVASSLLLLFAGHETTTHFLANGLLGLIEQPEAARTLAELRDDDARLNNAVNELLRWAGPSISMVRVLAEDVTMHGRTMRRGDRAYLFIMAANHDPRAFERPERIDLARPNAAQHLTFGYGIHTCLGAYLARIEGMEAFPALVERLHEVRCTSGAPGWNDSLIIRGMERMPVAFRAA